MCPGVDALSVHLILTVIAATLSIGISWKAVVGSLGIMIPWQLAHWEEYHTGRLLMLAAALRPHHICPLDLQSVGVWLTKRHVIMCCACQQLVCYHA